MSGGLLCGAIFFLLAGHFFKIVRWENFIKVYERPPVGILLKSMALGYTLNFFLPFRLGDIFRAIYSGRRMKNGIGFSLATIILDRFLDVVVVAIFFIIFNIVGIKSAVIDESTRFYVIMTCVIVLGFMVLGIFRTQIKRAALCLCSVFNDSIKLEGMKFFWSLINSFKDLWKLSPLRVLVITLFMWSGYMASYGLFALYLSHAGTPYGLVEVFTMLFSRASLDVNTVGSTNVFGDIFFLQRSIMLVYMLVPIVIMYTITFLPYGVKRKIGKKFFLSQDMETEDYLNILPQINSQDQLHFLDDYFSSNNREFIKKFIAMNRNISIIQDYSAGSNATTMLCMNKEKTFYRKYALGEDGNKLKEQLIWLEDHKDMMPLCEILFEEYGEGYCCYDMKYDSNAIGMFQYLHSHPLQYSESILKTVLDNLRKGLYTHNQKMADEATIENYLNSKVDVNLEKIKLSRQIRDLFSYDTLIINGKSYKNLQQFECNEKNMFDHQNLLRIFKNDSYSDIHGDLTIENIICLNDEPDFSNAYYIIDPNTGNIHNSQFLDYGKLLQSLHGGYEFMMMTKAVTVTNNRIDFMYTRSSVYDEMFEFFRQYLFDNFSEDEVSSIFHHEIIHWLRLMPYKLKKDKKRAAMFYAGLVMVINDVDRWFY